MDCIARCHGSLSDKCIGFTPFYLSSALPHRVDNLCNPLLDLETVRRIGTDHRRSVTILSLVYGCIRTVVQVNRKVSCLSIISGVLKKSRPIARASYVPSSRTPHAFVSFHPPAEKNGVSPKISRKTLRSILAIPHEAKTDKMSLTSYSAVK